MSASHALSGAPSGLPTRRSLSRFVSDTANGLSRHSFVAQKSANAVSPICWRAVSRRTAGPGLVYEH
jgi:hypothetical protein